MFGFGLLIGSIGTLVGVGGGFLVVPVAALIEPHWQTRTLTAYSLAVVSANACSGATAYLRGRRVDVRSATMFIAAALPGVVLGVAGADRFPRAWFDPIFGVLLLAMAAVLVIAPNWHPSQGRGSTQRELTDTHGVTYRWSFDVRLGLVGSAVVGVVSAVFGIGGGPIQVPFLVAVLNYPEHVATATSHAVLAATSLLATAIHIADGDYSRDVVVTVSTALGAAVGAPFGARLSRFVSGQMLMRLLAGMLAFIAVRLIVVHGGDARPSTDKPSPAP
jgi:uncharacterized membrane protein YfcA